jgi:hypothetical protein
MITYIILYLLRNSDMANKLDPNYFCAKVDGRNELKNERDEPSFMMAEHPWNLLSLEKHVTRTMQQETFCESD